MVERNTLWRGGAVESFCVFCHRPFAPDFWCRAAESGWGVSSIARLESFVRRLRLAEFVSFEKRYLRCGTRRINARSKFLQSPATSVLLQTPRTPSVLLSSSSTRSSIGIPTLTSQCVTADKSLVVFLFWLMCSLGLPTFVGFV